MGAGRTSSWPRIASPPSRGPDLREPYGVPLASNPRGQTASGTQLASKHGQRVDHQKVERDHCRPGSAAMISVDEGGRAIGAGADLAEDLPGPSGFRSRRLTFGTCSPPGSRQAPQPAHSPSTCAPDVGAGHTDTCGPGRRVDRSGAARPALPREHAVGSSSWWNEPGSSRSSGWCSQWAGGQGGEARHAADSSRADKDSRAP